MQQLVLILKSFVLPGLTQQRLCPARSGDKIFYGRQEFGGRLTFASLDTL